jgi:Skp family chaperone for outer membrane proteins
VPNQPTTSAKNMTGDSATFINFMRRLISVPHAEIKEKLDAERKAKRTPKTIASRVSAVPTKPA